MYDYCQDITVLISAPHNALLSENLHLLYFYVIDENEKRESFEKQRFFSHGDEILPHGQSHAWVTCVKACVRHVTLDHMRDHDV